MTPLRFDNAFVRELPGDPETGPRLRQVEGALYSRVDPTPVAAPRLLAHSPEMAQALGFGEADVAAPWFAEVFGGNRLLEGMQPWASNYGGHQFGHWAGQLGDGRAISLGEVVTAGGERWELQLKGAGPTPYSRTADGRAVLRSSIREFLCSEAMHHLGVPTTRALSLVGTGEAVLRDMFYDGHPEFEPGAVVCRVAPSFIRFGHFELPYARGDHTLLRQLVDFTIRRDFPHLEGSGEALYAAWFGEVCERTAQTVAHWMRVGFVHGVMNTDNLSILGLTIDYGPYGWLEDYDPLWTPNTTDAAGRRYCYGRQPTIAHWNLAQLANALHPLMGDPAPLEQALTDYSRRFEEGWQAAMAAKLGLKAFAADTDTALVQDMLGLLAEVETDMTLFYRHLAEIPAGTADDRPATETLAAPLMPALYQPEQLNPAYLEHLGSWLDRYRARLRHDGLDDRERQQRMDAVNPKYVLRNYLAQLAIDDIAAGNFSLTRELLDVLRHPYDEQPGRERFAEKRPEWARHRPGCSMLSCSS